MGWRASAAKFGATYGDQTTGGILSFGLPSSGNRAVGLLATSSTGPTAFGVKFVNVTAQTLTRMTVGFRGAMAPVQPPQNAGRSYTSLTPRQSRPSPPPAPPCLLERGLPDRSVRR